MDNFKNNSSSRKQKDIYFSNEENIAPKKPQKNAPKKKVKKKERGAGSTYLFFIIVIIVSIVISVYAIFCLNDLLAITKTKATVTVQYSQEIQDRNEIVDILSENGLIKCKNFCKFFLTLREKVISNASLDGPYEPGVYYLNGKMGLEGMFITLKGINEKSETVVLTFPEGYSTAEIVNKLSENDVCDKNALISVIQSTDFSGTLAEGVKASDKVPYRLEGYLFPDTYEFYIDDNASNVIRKFLSNGDKKYTSDFKKKQKELGMSTKEILTIASIIQMEAANESQMKKISAVIHNRLKDKANYPTLGCQSTSDYITNKVAPSLASTSSHTADYYMAYYNTNNDSTVIGLPEGPICNPGQAAIKAALNPEKSGIKFFFHDTNGVLYTASSYPEFKQKVQQYAPYLQY